MRIRSLPRQLNHLLERSLLEKIKLDGSLALDERLPIRTGEGQSDLDFSPEDLATRAHALDLVQDTVESFDSSLYYTWSSPDDVFVRTLALINQDFSNKRALATYGYVQQRLSFIENELYLRLEPPFNKVDINEGRLRVTEDYESYNRQDVPPDPEPYHITSSVIPLKDITTTPLNQFVNIENYIFDESPVFLSYFNKDLYVKNAPSQVINTHLLMRTEFGGNGPPDNVPGTYEELQLRQSIAQDVVENGLLFKDGSEPLIKPYTLNSENTSAAGVLEDDLYNYDGTSLNIAACKNDLSYLLDRSGKGIVTGDIIRYPVHPIKARNRNLVTIPFEISGHYVPCINEQISAENAPELHHILTNPSPYEHWNSASNFEKISFDGIYPQPPGSGPQVPDLPTGYNLYGGGTPWWNQYDFNDNASDPPPMPAVLPPDNPEHTAVDDSTYLHFHLKCPIQRFASDSINSIDQEGMNSQYTNSKSWLVNLERLHTANFAITNRNLYLVGGEYSRITLNPSSGTSIDYDGSPSPAIYHAPFDIPFSGDSPEPYNWIDYNGNHGTFNTPENTNLKWATFKSTYRDEADNANTQSLAEPLDDGSVLVYGGRMIVLGTLNNRIYSNSDKRSSYLYVTNFNQLPDQNEGHIGRVGNNAPRPFTEPHQILPLPVQSTKAVCIGPYLYYLMPKAPESLRPNRISTRDIYRSVIPPISQNSNQAEPIGIPQLFKTDAFPGNVWLRDARPVVIKDNLYLIGGYNSPTSNSGESGSLKIYRSKIDTQTYDLGDFEEYTGVTLPNELGGPYGSGFEGINEDNYGIFVTRHNLYVLWYTVPNLGNNFVHLRLTKYPIDSNGDLLSPIEVWDTPGFNPADKPQFNAAQYRGKIEIALTGQKLILGFTVKRPGGYGTFRYNEEFTRMSARNYSDHLSRQASLNDQQEVTDSRLRRTMNLFTVNYLGGQDNYVDPISTNLNTIYSGEDLTKFQDIDPFDNHKLDDDSSDGISDLNPLNQDNSGGNQLQGSTEVFTLPDLAEEDIQTTFGLRSFIKF